MPLQDPRQLADAFSEFISASSLLEASYRDLQREVAHLGTELAERNAALTRSLAENDRMRAALQQMIDSMPCGVLVLDTAKAIVMINPEGRRLLQLGNAPVSNLGELSATSAVDFGALSAQSEEQTDHEICLRSGAAKRWLAIGRRRLDCAPVRQSAEVGALALQSIWILRDITANKQAEQEREKARNAVALAEVSSILAHEIRNPLASMELFAGLIAQDQSQATQWISHLRAGIRLLSGTVNNVLSIHCGGNPEMQPVNLIACMRGGVGFVEPIAEQARVRLQMITELDTLMVRGNEEGLRQIALNLISNAIRHTPAGGEIEVRVREAVVGGESRALVEIRDTGCGIPEELMGRLFEAGFSASGDTPGLGLAVCKWMMERHGGEIRAMSRLNHGTTFQLEFPKA